MSKEESDDPPADMRGDGQAAPASAMIHIGRDATIGEMIVEDNITDAHLLFYNEGLVGRGRIAGNRHLRGKRPDGKA